MNSVRVIRSARASRLPVFLLHAAILLFAAAPAFGQPAFDKAFAPGTIGPGSTSVLTFTINNSGGGVVTDLAFIDNLPAGVIVADPATATTNCAGATLSAPEDGGTITLFDGQLGAGSSCSISVLVTAPASGTYMNVSGDLTSDAGNSGPATADLTVNAGLPGFSKSFSPSSAPLGSRSTLTFTIDNSANAAGIGSLDFVDNLPTGIVVADPPNASTTCGNSVLPTVITAAPGTRVITLDSDGFVPTFPAIAAGASCTVSVDVVADAVGFLDNVSENLLANFTSTGLAVATLESTVADIALVKEFLADPVPPGGLVTLEFQIFNFDRSFAATGLAFSDDLAATLAGLTFDSLLSNDCGGTVTGVGTTNLALTGGSVPSGDSCTVRASLAVPAGATPGVYPNTTSAVSGNLGGMMVAGNAATDDLFVEPVPLIEKAYQTNPVVPGDTVQLEFTITNASTTSTATDVAFEDIFDLILPTASVTPGNGCCGAGSACTYFPLINPPPPSAVVPARFSLSGGTLAPAGMAGDSCTFSITLDVDPNAPGGIYPNITSPVTATVDGAARSGAPASDDLVVVAAPSLVKNFTDDPVLPGEDVTLEFTLTHPAEAPAAATDISFTDDLDATLTGLIATGLPFSACGGTVAGVPDNSVIDFSGGSLTPGEDCTFPVTLSVPPAAAFGSYPNTTSTVTADVDGVAATSAPASDDLVLAGLSFAKAFSENPVIPGQTLTLAFTINNDSPTEDLTITLFADNLNAVLTGLSATGPAVTDTCGGSLVGASFLTYTGGSVPADSSCVIEVEVEVPASAPDGNYNNVTGELAASYGATTVTAPPAFDTLQVDSNRLTLTKEFTDDPVMPGDLANLRFTLTNLDATRPADNVAFTDDLDAALTGLTASGLPAAACGGTVDGIPNASVIDFSGGSLAPSEVCVFDVTVQVPPSAPAGVFTNTTSAVTGSIDMLPVTGAAADDDLRVVAITFTKAFNGPSVAGGTPMLSFTITNLDAANGIGSLAFTDDLNAVIPGLVATGLPLNNVCGSGSSVSGAGFLTFNGGDLAAAGSPGDTCTFQVPLAVPGMTTPGGYPNVTSNLTSAGLLTADPAMATLVIEPPPAFAKVFNPTAIAVNGTSTLTFTIDNSASVLAASDLDFTDNLPAGLEVAAMPNASTTCTGGTPVAIAGSGTISYTGGAVAAGASCTVQADVTGTMEGTLVNLTSALTSSSGTSGTATDTIDVVSGEFVVTKSFQTTPVLPGGLVNLELTITNGSSFALTDIGLTDDLDATLSGLVAEGLPQSNVCGMGSQISGTSFVTLTGGNLAASESCTVVVPVRVPAGALAGSYLNTTSTATGTRGGVGVDADPDSDDLVVAPLTFEKTLTPTVAPQDSTINATFTITNPDPANGATGLTFSDDLDAFVSGMTATGTGVVDICGTGSNLAGTSTVTLAGGSLAGGGSCTFQVTLNIPAGTSGDFTNTTSTLTGQVGGNAISVPAASADLSVPEPPIFGKAFDPTEITGGDTSVLTFTIDNGDGALAASNLDFTDNLPAGVVLAATPAASTTCTGGSFNAAAGTGTFGYSNGSVAANSSCTVSVAVTANNPGVYDNVSGDLTSTLGNSGTAGASLTVTTQPTFAKAFAPDTISGGDTSVLTFTIDNTAQPLDATDLDFTDNLPAGVALAGTPAASTTCTGGSFSAAAGTGTFGYSNGSVAANASCTVSVTVTASNPGVYDNVSGDLTSSLGNSGTAGASLTVTTQPTFAKAFAPDTISGGDTSVLTFTIDNTAQPLAANDLAFTDPLPAGLVLADPVAAANDCGGALSATAGSATIGLSGGSLADGATCTISANVTAADPGTYDNLTGDLTSTLGGLPANSGTAGATLTVITQPEFTKAFNPSTIPGGETSVLTLTIDNSAQPLDANDLAFTDPLPADVVLADPVDAVTDCGGTLSASPGGSSLSLAFASIGAGETCTVSVNVESTVPGTYDNITSDLTSTLGGLNATADPATATLIVTDDSDGVPADIEDQAPNNGDGNDDGIPDRIQDDVASLPTFDDDGFITVAITNGCDQLNNVIALSPTSQPLFPENLEFSFGLVGFELPCESAIVDVIFAGDTALLGNRYFKFAPTTPGQAVSADWFDFSDPPAGATTGATLSGNVWTLTLADNQLGDATGDDGVIVDPGGPAQQFVAIPFVTPMILLLMAAILGIMGLIATSRSRIDKV